ncbi:MAG: lysophospholipid acyltransferase family protein [Sedimentisphaerales bacterium]|jgi:lysophospholipid acyltransferase (LPLAT)-like uncharacterized protein|nr:lysophospholipid acyltransferase family protein [Sedimentisphaerales bacterium]
MVSLTARVGPLLLRILGSTNRISVDIPPDLIQSIQEGGNILAFWHSRLFYLSYYYTYRQRLPRVTVLLSRSRDGDYAYAFARGLGHHAIRGSTRRGGTRALKGLMKSLAEGSNILITPDGPRGPAFKVQRGLIWLASVTGARIIPASYDASSKWVLNSWDRFMIPRPFSRIHIAADSPTQVPPEIDDIQLEAFRLQLESTLHHLDQLCNAKVCASPGT